MDISYAWPVLQIPCFTFLMSSGAAANLQWELNIFLSVAFGCYGNQG